MMSSATRSIMMDDEESLLRAVTLNASVSIMRARDDPEAGDFGN